MKQQVLVVDDDPSVHRLVSSILRRRGFEVMKSSSGRECLERVKEGFKGLILMDVVMPELNGWQTIRALADDHLLEGNVVCMLTGINSPGEEAEGLQEGVVDYITKPFNVSDLVQVVDGAMSLLEPQP